jgi:hypothetical protein
MSTKSSFPTWTHTRAIARECLRTAYSPDGATAQENCDGRMHIFSPGYADYGEATQHDVDAITNLSDPKPFLLHRKPG